MPERHFFWDPVSDSILQERDENGNVVVEYAREPDGTLISENRGGVERQYHCDPTGNVLALTDDNQNVTDTFAYNASGEQTERTGTTPTPYRYHGQQGYYFDENTGEYYVQRRDLDPSQGRWLSADPLEFIDGLNRYWYARNNPIRFFDPFGLFCVEEKPAVDCEGALATVLERIKGVIEEMKKGEPPCELPPITCCPMEKPKGITIAEPCIQCYPQKAGETIFGTYNARTKTIYICPSNALDQTQLEATILEEMQHSFDRCKFEGKFGFEDDCLDKACLELRGKTFAGECDVGSSSRKPGESRDDCLVRRVASSLLFKCKANAKETALKVLKDPKCKQLKPIPKPKQ